jgi:hypothetical protein
MVLLPLHFLFILDFSLENALFLLYFERFFIDQIVVDAERKFKSFEGVYPL